MQIRWVEGADFRTLTPAQGCSRGLFPLKMHDWQPWAQDWVRGSNNRPGYHIARKRCRTCGTVEHGEGVPALPGDPPCPGRGL